MRRSLVTALTVVCLGGGLALAGGSGVAWAQDALTARAERLAALRAEVASTTAELTRVKEDARGRLRSLDTQLAELEGQVRREELRSAQLTDELDRLRASTAARAAGAQALTPAVLDGCGAIRAAIAAGPPFHRNERLAAVDEISTGVSGGLLAADTAAGRLWSVVEDERRLARENGLDRQVVELGSESLLADVAHLGLLAVYFQSPDGRAGLAEKRGDTWTWREVTAPDERRAIASLFTSLRKGLRSGWNVLPNPLPPEGA